MRSGPSERGHRGNRLKCGDNAEIVRRYVGESIRTSLVNSGETQISVAMNCKV